jgi:hypothetical protein
MTLRDIETDTTYFKAILYIPRLTQLKFINTTQRTYPIRRMTQVSVMLIRDHLFIRMNRHFLEETNRRDYYCIILKLNITQ